VKKEKSPEDILQPTDHYTEPPFIKYEIINLQKAFEQCGEDQDFLDELLNDVLNEKSTRLSMLREASVKNDHKAYSECAHAIKGAASNLFLEGLEKVSKKAEYLGKYLKDYPNDSNRLTERALWIKRLSDEYDRLSLYLKDPNRPKAKINSNNNNNNNNNYQEDDDEELSFSNNIQQSQQSPPPQQQYQAYQYQQYQPQQSQSKQAQSTK